MQNTRVLVNIFQEAVPESQVPSVKQYEEEQRHLERHPINVSTFSCLEDVQRLVRGHLVVHPHRFLEKDVAETAAVSGIALSEVVGVVGRNLFDHLFR